MISVEGLGKRYRLAHQGPRGAFQYYALRDVIADRARRAARAVTGRGGKASAQVEDFWALRDVSFSVGAGEVLGVIGRNGAGKSTLLKLLSRITEPTRGRITLRGRIASLLEVGTGFHPELTGRENIYMNGAILGMRKAEIARKFDEIVEFAEVERFLDTPVKRYSSGMYVRLAFAVAAHLEPEVLVVDEVLAVGDANFQRKCIGKMENVSRMSGRTVLFVSHNMAAIESLCPRAILLQNGTLVKDGPTAQIVEEYMGSFTAQDSASVDLSSHRNRSVARRPIFRRITTSTNGVPSPAVKMGEGLEIRLRYDSGEPVRDLRIGITINDLHGQRLVSLSPTFMAPDALANAPGRGEIVLRVPELFMLPNYYNITVIAANGTEDLDRIDNCAQVEVLPADVYTSGKPPASNHGFFYLQGAWSIEPATDDARTPA